MASSLVMTSALPTRAFRFEMKLKSTRDSATPCALLDIGCPSQDLTRNPAHVYHPSESHADLKLPRDDLECRTDPKPPLCSKRIQERLPNETPPRSTRERLQN